MWKIVERRNELACHGHFHSEDSADFNLTEVIPIICSLGLFMDKTLTPEDFIVIFGRP